MAEPSPKEISTRYRELSERLADLRRERGEFVEEESRRMTSEREDFSGMFATTSIRRFGPDNPIHRDRGEERLEVINDVLEEIENSEGYRELTRELEGVGEELDEVWDEVERVIVEPGKTKKENIGRIWSLLGPDVDNRRLVEAVDCHPQYPGRLEYDPDLETARYKERVSRRKENQVRTDHRQEILERDGLACVRCGNKEIDELTVHHIIPVSQGGAAEDSNLATLCSDCHDKAHKHSSKGTVRYRDIEEFWEWVQQGSRGFQPF